MKRRDFLKTSLAASAAATLGATTKLSAAGSAATTGREFYELRAYRLKPGASSAALDSYLAKALIPALNARGIADIGAFTELDIDKTNATSKPKADSPVWVFIPHASLESFVSVSADLNLDPTVVAIGAEYLNAPKTNPAFDRIDTWLLRAFAGMPKHAVPTHSRDKMSTRVFELRSYESFSELKALKKIAMFHAGEIDLMKELGMSPVFFGQAIAGRDMPHLSYITSAPDLATHLNNWKKFSAHPTWAKIKDDPQYADTVSKNTSRFCSATVYSQI